MPREPDETVTRKGSRYRVRFKERGVTWWFEMTVTGPVCTSAEADDRGASIQVSRAAAGRAYTLVRDKWEEDLLTYFRKWLGTQPFAHTKSTEYLLEEWLRGVTLYQEMELWWKKSIIESLEKKHRHQMAERGGKTRSTRVKREKVKAAQLAFRF